jgi:hypothetical protein
VPFFSLFRLLPISLVLSGVFGDTKDRKARLVSEHPAQSKPSADFFTPCAHLIVIDADYGKAALMEPLDEGEKKILGFYEQEGCFDTNKLGKLMHWPDRLQPPTYRYFTMANVLYISDKPGHAANRPGTWDIWPARTIGRPAFQPPSLLE